MAKRRTDGPKKMIAADVEAKSIRLELLPEMHQKFRVEAAKEGMSMAAVARTGWSRTGSTRSWRARSDLGRGSHRRAPTRRDGQSSLLTVESTGSSGEARLARGGVGGRLWPCAAAA